MFIYRYGDRSPKSTLGRVFCILWIITGLVIISIFIAMVTASLAATTHPHFPIHGSLVSVSIPQLTFFLFFFRNSEKKGFYCTSLHIFLPAKPDLDKGCMAIPLDESAVLSKFLSLLAALFHHNIHLLWHPFLYHW